MLNFHHCFEKTPQLQDDTYLNNLTLRTEQEKLLKEARTVIRETLRKAIREATSAFSEGEKQISPSFFTQGSWAYHTINRPAHTPPQQTDMDDGCYLPMTFVRGTTPKRAANWFYDVADKALQELVKARNWKAYDASRQTCCRVIIDEENHVDVPLYAIRDDQFEALLKAYRAETAALKMSDARLREAAEDDHPLDWTQVTDKDVLLAQRNGFWKDSNPRDVSNWAKSAVGGSGEQLRWAWRIMKGWRDHTFVRGGPSSIALMVIIQHKFEEVKNRDDLAVRAAAIKVSEAIMHKVSAPWNKNEDLCEKLKPDERAAISRLAQRLADEIDQCTQGHINNAEALLKRLGSLFGKHFCETASRVKTVTPQQVVRAYVASPVVAPSLRGDNRSA